MTTPTLKTNQVELDAFAPSSTYTLLRLPAVLKARGRSRSSHYADIKQGLFTRQVNLRVHCVGWPEHEVMALNAARIAGKTDQEIRDLVQHLEAHRKRGT
ncbi:AlpA family transcriptional regulator [Geothrix sp. 21YS21S-4]|uniref:helix-turn-helix transcriptional regulator n=1 Tax=Geothrix sp. 21YS21S-4 TaxID=3068889 RepID=UPI0027B9CB8D|nr:AlpA family phage regulatory protein [Geothrix sp. 21YS21S-4]